MAGLRRIRALPGPSTGILPASVASRFLTSSTERLIDTIDAASRSLVVSPLYGAEEWWPLIATEGGFLVAAIFAGIEVWATSRKARKPPPAGGASAAAIAAAAAEEGRSRTAAGGIVLLHGALGAGGSRGGQHPNRRGSADTDDRRSPGTAAGQRGTSTPASAAPGGRPPAASSQQNGPSEITAAAIKHSGQSSGDSTRRAFFVLIFLALLSRLLLLPVQAFYFSPASSPHGIHPDTGLCMESSACIFSRTLPDLAFASAFSLLVLFYAQLAGTASGGGPRGLTFVLTRRRLFPTINMAVYAAYAVLFLLTGPVPLLPYALFQTVVWSMLCVVYLVLLCLLAYFGPVLVGLLRPSLARRSALAIRLIAMCVLCTVVFLSRTICFGIAVYRTDYRWTHGIISNVIAADSYQTQFDQNLLGYTLLEMLPSLAILGMMHQRRPGGGSSTSPSAAAGTTPPAGNGGGGVGGAGNSGGSGGDGGGGGRRGGGRHHNRGHSPASFDGGGMTRVRSGSAPKRAGGGGGGGPALARTTAAGMGVGGAAVGMAVGGGGGHGLGSSSSEGVALLGGDGRNAAYGATNA